MNAAANAHRPLKLRARDAEDLEVLSAHLQDAIVAICDVAYVPEERQFILCLNRFKWEVADGEDNPVPQASRPAPEAGPDGEAGGSVFARTHCGVRFEDVGAVRCRNIDLRDRTHLLNLLAIQPVDRGVLLSFAGGAEILLETASICCCMSDMGEPWPTTNRPRHRLGDSEPAPQAA